MQCFCCERELASARRVKIRRWVEFDPLTGGPQSAAYLSYKEQMTYRWAEVCQGCYSTLDNYFGLNDVAGQRFSLDGNSRGDRARTIDEEEYRKIQRRAARRLGLDPDE
jgi:hypothetical protein